MDKVDALSTTQYLRRTDVLNGIGILEDALAHRQRRGLKRGLV
jgi:hypothetical protein